MQMPTAEQIQAAPITCLDDKPKNPLWGDLPLFQLDFPDLELTLECHGKNADDARATLVASITGDTSNAPPPLETRLSDALDALPATAKVTDVIAAIQSALPTPS